MAMDFPSSPTNGQVFTSGGVAYTWNGYAWIGGGIPAAGADAPSDGNEYVRVNGLWRMIKQTLWPAAGSSQIDVAVPSWATMVEMTGSCFVGGPTANIALRVGDGTTIWQGATDYWFSGPIHHTTPPEYIQLGLTNGSTMYVTGDTDYPWTPLHFHATMNVARGSTSGQYHMKTFTSHYSTANTYSTSWYMGNTYEPPGSLRLGALRFFTPAATFSAGSQIHLRWL